MKSNDIHIGEKVRAVFEGKGLKASEFSSQIGQARQNLQHVLGRETMDTGLLFNVSQVLEFDFFKEYSQRLGLQHSAGEAGGNVQAKGEGMAALETQLRVANLELASARTEIKYLKEIVDLLRQRPGA